jgi:hypothetical protein
VTVDPVLNLWMKFQRNIQHTYDCPGFTSFVHVVEVYVGFASELSLNNSFIKQST